ncbi:hypothetical protein PO909_008619 [Leuciscus waleckii]
MEVEDRLRSSFEKNGCGLTSGHWGIVEAPQGAQAPARYQQGEPVPAQSPVGAPMPDGSPQGIPVPKALVTTVSSEEAPVPALSSEEAPMYAGSPEEAPVPARSPFRRKVRIPYNVPTTSPEEVPVPNSSQEEAPVPTASPEETPVLTTSSEQAPVPASSQEEAPMSTASPRSTFNSQVTDFKHIEEEKAEFRRKLQTWFPGIEGAHQSPDDPAQVYIILLMGLPARPTGRQQQEQPETRHKIVQAQVLHQIWIRPGSGGLR